MNDDFFHLRLFENDEEDDEHEKNHGQVVDVSSNTDEVLNQESSSLPLIHSFQEAMEFLSRPIPMPIQEIDHKINENLNHDGHNDGNILMHYQNIISTYLGSMAQCRAHNKEIHSLGGIHSLMSIIHVLIVRNCSRTFELIEIELELANASLGALRDLACGNATNRLQIGQYEASVSKRIWDDCIPVGGPGYGRGEHYNNNSIGAEPQAGTQEQTHIITGIDIISYFINIYSNQTWEQTPKDQLRNMTNALGVMRNITHSTPYNCRSLHELGMTTVLANRIRCRMLDNAIDGNTEADDGSNAGTFECVSSLPDASKPWREASYRIAGTLINMAEKCNDVAVECAKDEDLILILIESWGGIVVDLNMDVAVDEVGSPSAVSDSAGKQRKKKKNKAIPVLHLGLKAILMEYLDLEEHNYEHDHSVSLGVNDSNLIPTVAIRTQRLRSMIQTIMEREDRRKLAAQERENSRKKKG